MIKSPQLAKKLAVLCLFIFPQLIFIQSSHATTPTYTAEFTVSGFSSPTWITRGGGFIWVSENSAIKKVNEVTGTVSATYALTSTPQEIAFDGTDVYALLANSRIAKVTAASGTISYSAAAVCASGGSNDSIAATVNVIIISCFSAGQVARYQNSDLTELQRVSLTSAGRSVIANNFGYVTQFAGLSPTWKYSLSSLSSPAPTSIATANYTNWYHRVTADSNYVWILSGNTGVALRLVRISLVDNSVTTITLNDFNLSSYSFNSISSNGTTLFMTFSTTSRIVAFDIATSTVTNTITPASTPNGISAVINGFWVVVGSTLVKYSSASAPAAPTLNSVTGSDKRVTVAFTAGANNGASITDYEYSLNGGSYISAGTTTSPFTITGLNGRASYSVTLKARNSSGLSAASSSLSATTTDASLDASESSAVAARVAAAAEAARVAAAAAKQQKELTEILSLIPELGKLSLNIGETSKALAGQKCVKKKQVKYVFQGERCPKGFVKRR
jgi:hypothetical protein